MAKIDRDRIAHIAKHAPERHPEPRPEYAPSESAELARHRLETEWYERSGKYMLEEYQDASKDAWNRLREAVDLAMQREAGQKPTEHELSLRQIRIADGRESETGEEPKRTALNREIMAEFPRPGSSGEQESAGQSREVVSTNDRGEGSER